MGMDVIGNNPKSEVGEYFRNNVWWWRPLWDYCCFIAPEMCEKVNGHFNDGDGLNNQESMTLSKLIVDHVNSGAIDQYITARNKALSELPHEDCNLCDNTGIRTDAIGLQHGMPTEKLPEEVAIVVGRTHGTCNGCKGLGWRESFMLSYPFDKENVIAFSKFLEECGGFRIC